ncbi:MAG TPA: ABATE domain-containing protein, partial [Terriglobales bacterium]|nr:ABATE domain-containing protein [Terriglobales bacterium]
MAEPTAPLFLGGHPALDFLNTAFAPNGIQIEAIGSGPAFIDWLVSAELLTKVEANELRSHSSGKVLESAAAT